MSHCTECGHSHDRQAPSAACVELNRVATLLQAAWAKADPESGVAKHPTSYIATFVDMARALRDDVANRRRACRGMTHYMRNTMHGPDDRCICGAVARRR